MLGDSPSLPTTHRGTETPRNYRILLRASVPPCVRGSVRRFAFGFLLLLLLFHGVIGAQTKPVRLTYLFSDGNLPGTLKAFKALLQERPDLRGKVQLTFVTESVLSDVKADELKTTDVLVLDTMNQQMLERVNADSKIDLIGDGARSTRQSVRDRRRAAAEGDLHQPGRALGRPRSRLLGAHGLLESGRPDEVRADAGRRQGAGLAGAAAEPGLRLLLPGAGRSKRTGPPT